MKTAKDIQIGDLILPPERELRLWMRREITKRNLPEVALHFRVESISESRDARGPWLFIKTRYSPLWGHTHTFTFRARPETPWKFAACEEFRPLVNGGDYRGTRCAICGEKETEHATGVQPDPRAAALVSAAAEASEMFTADELEEACK